MAKRGWVCRTYLDERENRNLTAKAREAGITVSAFIRKSIENCEVRAAAPADLYKLILEIRRVGNNLDQILAIANTKGLLDASQLREALTDLRNVEKMIADTYSQVPVRRHIK
jgi:hypothetical protein